MKGARLFYINVDGWNGSANLKEFCTAFTDIRSGAETRDQFIAGGIAGMNAPGDDAVKAVKTLSSQLFVGYEPRVYRNRVFRYYSHTRSGQNYYSYMFVRAGVSVTDVGNSFLYKRADNQTIGPKYCIGTETFTNAGGVVHPPDDHIAIQVNGEAVNYNRVRYFPGMFHARVVCQGIEFVIAFANNAYTGDEANIFMNLLGDAFVQIGRAYPTQHNKMPIIIGGTFNISPPAPVGHSYHAVNEGFLGKKYDMKTTSTGVADFWVTNVERLRDEVEDQFINGTCYAHDVVRYSLRNCCPFAVRLTRHSAISMEILGPSPSVPEGA